MLSAGTGVQHSEFNPNKDKKTNLLQIWIFPKIKNVEPRYQQITLDTSDRHNNLQQILSPNADDAGVWIHQDAWFHMGNLDKGTSIVYNRKKEGNGLYVFVIKGSLKVDGQGLEQRDGLGITNFEKVIFEATEDNEILLMEVPMG
jgi:redox-sensitive bicupin YhaK (pirin superfamily)